jgi:hypothetical protein
MHKVVTSTPFAKFEFGPIFKMLPRGGRGRVDIACRVGL